MKKIWDKIGVFPVTEQRLAEQARQIRTNKLLTDIDIEEIRMKLERKNSKVEIQQNIQEIIEIIEHNGNQQGPAKERWTQEILVEQGHENEQQQKTQKRLDQQSKLDRSGQTNCLQIQILKK